MIVHISASKGMNSNPGISRKIFRMKSKHVMLVMVVSGALSSAAALYPVFCGGFMKIPQQAMCIFDLTQVCYSKPFSTKLSLQVIIAIARVSESDRLIHHGY